VRLVYIGIFPATEQQNETSPYTLQATFSPPEWCRSFRPPLSDSGHPGKFKIGTPEHCADDLPHTGVQIGGTYTCIPEEDEEDLEVWVLVYPTDNKYYPQSNDACNGEPALFGGGFWSVSGNLGEVPDDIFDIVVVVTDKGSDASSRFKQYLIDGCNNTYEGIPDCEMPTDLTEKAYITVRTGTATPTPTPGPTPPPCISFRPSLSDSGDPGEFEIVTPADRADDVPHRVQIAGTYNGISDEDGEDLEVWTLVYPHLVAKYYPQSSNACSECPTGFGGGVWNVVGQLGREGVSECFDIVVVVTNTDSQASARFKQYLRHGCDYGDYIPIPSFEIQDVTEKASVTVRSLGAMMKRTD